MFKVSGYFQSEMQHINVIKSLNTCIAFMLWYVLKQWNTALRDVMILNLPSFFSGGVCVCTCAHTLSLLPPPPDGICTVTVFQWVKSEENFIFSSSAFKQASRRRVKQGGKVLLMIQFTSSHQQLNFHFTQTPQLVHIKWPVHST